MSNLGAYQEFTTAASQAGGVENYLDDLNSQAVDDARPAQLMLGVFIGAAALTVGGFLYKHLEPKVSDKYRSFMQKQKNKSLDELGGHAETSESDQ